MSLNLKNPKAHELAAQLAGMTGESLTTAVIKALELRIRQESRERNREEMAEEIVAFVQRHTKGRPTDFKSTDHGDLLYDADGLPK